MALFLIERNFAEQLEVSPEAAAGIVRINDDIGVRWLYSFLSADKKKTYCLYEAPSAELIREAARRNGLPADVVIEVGQLHPPLTGGLTPA
jgi:Nickel responsive protein SCO4226-like